MLAAVVPSLSRTTLLMDPPCTLRTATARPWIRPLPPRTTQHIGLPDGRTFLFRDVRWTPFPTRRCANRVAVTISKLGLTKQQPTILSVRLLLLRLVLGNCWVIPLLCMWWTLITCLRSSHIASTRPCNPRRMPPTPTAWRRPYRHTPRPIVKKYAARLLPVDTVPSVLLLWCMSAVDRSYFTHRALSPLLHPWRVKHRAARATGCAIARLGVVCAIVSHHMVVCGMGRSAPCVTRTTTA